MSDTNRLEQVQLNAARSYRTPGIVFTYMPLSLEIGLETLAERRKTKKLILIYK